MMALHHTLTHTDVFVRALTGTLLGILIGAERQYRARTAGLRTNALVSTGATLFVLLSAKGFVGDYGVPDPTRVAAQIVSGIGFLGAGVIMRDGINVRGINTAATLWCSAAVGALAGAGLIEIAVLGTGIILCVNILLRQVSRMLLKIPGNGGEQPTNYIVTVKGRGKNNTKNREYIMKSLKATHYHLRAVETETDDEDYTIYRVWLYTEDKDEKDFESAIRMISVNPAFVSVQWKEEVEQPKENQRFFSQRLTRRSAMDADGSPNPVEAHSN